MSEDDILFEDHIDPLEFSGQFESECCDFILLDYDITLKKRCFPFKLIAAYSIYSIWDIWISKGTFDVFSNDCNFDIIKFYKDINYSEIINYVNKNNKDHKDYVSLFKSLDDYEILKNIIIQVYGDILKEFWSLNILNLIDRCTDRSGSESRKKITELKILR